MSDINNAALPGVGRPERPDFDQNYAPQNPAPSEQTMAAVQHAMAGATVAPAAADDPNKIFLSRPMTTHQGQVTVLGLRTPSAGDYIDMGGYPFTAKGIGTDKMELDIDFAKCAKWMARLADVEEMLIRQLPQKDFLQGVEKVVAIVAAQGDDMGN